MTHTPNGTVVDDPVGVATGPVDRMRDAMRNRVAFGKQRVDKLADRPALRGRARIARDRRDARDAQHVGVIERRIGQLGPLLDCVR